MVCQTRRRSCWDNDHLEANSLSHAADGETVSAVAQFFGDLSELDGMEVEEEFEIDEAFKAENADSDLRYQL